MALNPAAATSAEAGELDCGDVDIDYLEGEDLATLDLVADDEIHEEDDDEDDDNEEEQEEAAAAAQVYGVAHIMDTAGFHEPFTNVRTEPSLQAAEQYGLASPPAHNALFTLLLPASCAVCTSHVLPARLPLYPTK